MRKDEIMHIVSCADDNYARHLGGMFVSLLTNMDQRERLNYTSLMAEFSLITKKDWKKLL